MTVVAVLQWWRKRKRQSRDADRARAEALVEVEARGMMGGKPHALRVQHIPRRPRLRPAPLAIEHEGGE